MMKQKITERISEYDPNKIRIGVLGSHSALKLLQEPNKKVLKPLLFARKAGRKPIINITRTYSIIF